ncbi:NAD(P)-binding protein [Stemphylium lycopersici]|uniref:NAD(P)-binding protein n=1 Tax=Stemphylium lycopersici TaxID=183478 RepID=A0A364MSU9_STELY|nr:hypothetical protein TW65_99365 [Stemphylium lycopersici]RAQ98872.1 NAD(P)-binding protein [Stemphylium lycopersici]RAR02284.1 NAD(P)-binding protein [Stemphylium lycopersici]
MSALEDILGDTSAARPRLTFLVHDIAGQDRGLYHGPVLQRLSQVDELVFNAWDTNWGKPLDAFAPLLEALRRMVDLLVAAPGDPRITFVSSICAVGSWPLLHPEQPVIPEEVIWDCRSAMPHGYGESKCIAEQLLAKAHEATKLRINILRVSQIGGPQYAKHWLWPRQGWLYSIIALSKRIGAFPEHVQAIDWIPVDALAHAISNCLKPSPGLDGLQVFNMVHPQPAAWSLFHEILRANFGIPAQTMDLPSWLDRIKDGDLRIQKFLRAQGGGREMSLSFANVRALKALPPISQMSAELLEAWLQGWKLGPVARL